MRISGNDALNVAKKIFVPKSVDSIDNIPGYGAAYGEIIDDDGALVDTGVITVFRSPRSYTGENVVEISCHGGIFVTNHVLHIILKNGAVMAEPGEFSKRAFMNGKMTLTQAESVIDIISARSEQAVRMASAAGEGRLFKKVSGITEQLLELSAYFGAWFDYPEEDMDEFSHEDIERMLKSADDKISVLIDGYDQGKIIKDGIPTVIVGKPNVGKSTLMNLFAGTDRSIVTDIPGTTRDIVEESVRLGDLILNISDTAGIRSTSDIVERFGVELAQKRISTSHLVLAVFDGSEQISAEDRHIARLTRDKNTIAIVNKTDLDDRIDRGYLHESFDRVVYISAKNSDGVDELKAAITDVLGLSDFDPSAAILASERQLEAAREAKQYLDECLDAFRSGVTYDLVSVILESAIDCLLQLTGERAGDKIVETVFARFCLGK